MKRILCITGLILIGIVAYQNSRLKKVREENRILGGNVATLMEGVRQYRIRDSLHAASSGMLEMQVAEFKKRRQEDVRLIEELKIKLKRVENISVHSTETRMAVNTVLQDTVFESDSVRHFDYRTAYIELNGILRKDSVQFELTSYDTLMQVIHRIPKRFLFIRYGTKAIRQEIVSKNPHTRITYTEYIRIKR